LTLQVRCDQTKHFQTRNPLANGRPSHPENIAERLHIRSAVAVQMFQNLAIS
jgi:hypothetical protein